jgi:hypothetical protein
MISERLNMLNKIGIQQQGERVLFSGMSHHIFFTDMPEKCVASVFGVKE